MEQTSSLHGNQEQREIKLFPAGHIGTEDTERRMHHFSVDLSCPRKFRKDIQSVNEDVAFCNQS